MATFSEFMRLAEYTIEDKTSSKRMGEILSILRKNHVMKGLTPEKAVTILEELGPTFVKVGQIASNRADLLPISYCEAFGKLRANVEPLDFPTVVACINKAYGHPYTDVFASIDEKPLGSASIAQVHRATLRDGTVVAVKVRRPGIVEEMAADIMMMKHALALAEFSTTRHEDMMLTLDGFVNELERTTNDEVDFTVELNNLVRFKKEIAGQKGVTSPTPYPQFSNDAILVMEFVEGSEVDKIDKLHLTQKQKDELAQRITQSYVCQVLDYGFFHADPHPGNIIIRGNDMVWIDLGMTGTLSASERQIVGKIFRAVATSSAYDLKESILGLTDAKGPIDHGKLLDEVEKVLSSYGSSELGDINVGNVLSEVIEVLREQNLIVHPSVTMLARGVITLEGVVSDMSPKTNITQIVSKHVLEQTFTAQHMTARAMDLMTSSIESAEALTKLPTQLSHALNMLGRGQISVLTNMEVSVKALATIYAIGGRLALALISAGLFLGSSILCTTSMEPKLLEVPILGVLGYLGAFVLSVYVIVRTLQDRHRMVNNEDLE